MNPVHSAINQHLLETIKERNELAKEAKRLRTALTRISALTAPEVGLAPAMAREALK